MSLNSKNHEPELSIPLGASNGCCLLWQTMRRDGAQNSLRVGACSIQNACVSLMKIDFAMSEGRSYGFGMPVEV